MRRKRRMRRRKMKRVWRKGIKVGAGGKKDEEAGG